LSREVYDWDSSFVKTLVPDFNKDIFDADCEDPVVLVARLHVESVLEACMLGRDCPPHPHRGFSSALAKCLDSVGCWFRMHMEVYGVIYAQYS
jgi:hypothetical protein